MKTVLRIGVVVAASCGGGNSATPDAHVQRDGHAADAASEQNVVTGDLGGAAFTAGDAIWANVSAAGFDYNAMSTDITLTTFANACAGQMTQTGTPDGRYLVFVLATTDADGNSSPISAAGTYTIFSGTPPSSSSLVEAYFEADDSSCQKSTSELATSGTVTVTSPADPQSATFDVTFPDGHVTGSYRANSCTALDPNSSPSC